ncbi:ATP-binding protein [Solwaraspora sp. WMMB335]|uniref:ATP-binding protein n=1 Tax=Solwaraspora sp. WMMB335 TaxID=3404118 RepID=UPI003B924906
MDVGETRIDGHGQLALDNGTFGATVRRHRRRMGLTQQELADRTGLSVRGIGKLEAGRVNTARPATVRLLADVFGLTGSERDRFCAGGREAPPQPRSGPAAPEQLPPDVAGFTGRSEQLALLDEWLDAADPSAALVISAIAGTAGVGKTALAVRWAHRVRARFPDGQLYVNLRGYDPDEPVEAADALARMLTALGVAAPAIPMDVDERAARYRSELADRRMLILLDNAGGVDQVRPLLPGTATSTVVVTSRDSLAGLVALDGARRLDLDLLSHAEARQLLRRLVGARVDAEPDATETLVARCARLPLALRICAESALSRPDTVLADLADELTDQQQRLSVLAADGDRRAAVTAVFSWSIRHLPAEPARVFRLLGLHPGPDFGPDAVAALAGVSSVAARGALRVLARAHLVGRGGPDRYAMHDLLRAYASQLAGTDLAGPAQRAAQGRLFDHYLASASVAVDALYRAEQHCRPPVSTMSLTVAAPPTLAEPDAARSWLDGEMPCLVTAVGYTATHGWPVHSFRLAAILHRHLKETGQYLHAATVHGHAWRAAQQAGELIDQGNALSNLGAVEHRLGRNSAAARHHQLALDLFRQAGDATGEGTALTNLGFVAERQGRCAAAAESFGQALGLFRAVDDHMGEAYALTHLGLVEQRLGRDELAADHLGQALAMFRKQGDPTGAAYALNDLGFSEHRLGEDDRALGHIDAARTLFRQLDNPFGEAHALNNAGLVCLRQGRHAPATEHLTEALAIFQQIGDQAGEARARNGLGEVECAAGRPADALAHHSAARAIATQTDAGDQEARAYAGLGQAHQVLHNRHEACAHYRRAIDRYAALGLPEADEIRARLATL